MDISNLARVFGPTIVGHAVPNPDPMTILQDTKRQPKVGLDVSSCLLYVMSLQRLVIKWATPTVTGVINSKCDCAFDTAGPRIQTLI